MPAIAEHFRRHPPRFCLQVLPLRSELRWQHTARKRYHIQEPPQFAAAAILRATRRRRPTASCYCLRAPMALPAEQPIIHRPNPWQPLLLSPEGVRTSTMLSSQTVSYAAAVALVFDALSPGGCFLSMCALPTALTAQTVLQCLPLDPCVLDRCVSMCHLHACHMLALAANCLWMFHAMCLVCPNIGWGVGMVAAPKRCNICSASWFCSPPAGGDIGWAVF
mmetsp:Transcript_6793/g.14871  ORF Transcript_6793/g.14871 Transcript_6793/m.14871 type:complete len:221 (+) Transcript_6793:853-1515(+)